MTDFWPVFLTAMTPLGELRASIPLAVFGYGLSLGEAYLISVLGNILPIIFVLLFLDKADDFLRKRYAWAARFFDWLYHKTHSKGKAHMEKWGHLALVIFVALPLPGTGAWSGAVLALLFNLPFKRALLLISLGVMIAGVIMTTLVGFLGKIF